MMGDRAPGDEPRVSAFTGTLFIIVLVLVGVVFFTGASTALNAQTHSGAGSVDHGASVDAELADPVIADQQAQGALPQQDGTTAVPFEDLVDANDSVKVTDSEMNVTVLTAQLGDVDSPRKPKDVVLVPEQSFAMHTFWGSYYPSSHTPEFIANNQEVLKVSGGQQLNDKSYTALGDWLGIGGVISGPFPYDCGTYSGLDFWNEDHWCGWDGDNGVAEETMYHINASKSLSIINGFDLDMDNWKYNTMLRTGDGWMELPTGVQDYWKDDGIDDYQEDEIYDNPDASEFEHINIPLNDLYYIAYNFGSDTWGIDTDHANKWIRMRYDSLLAEVDNVAPLDPFAMRFKAMEDTVEILNGAMGDQVAIIPNGEVENSLSESFVDADLNLDDFEDADQILNDAEYFNATDASSQLDQAESDIGNLTTEIDPADYAEFNVWDTSAQPGGFAKAINEIQSIDESERDSDKHIVLITGGQQPLRPQDEWYEKIANDILEGMPDFFGLFPDRITEERPDPGQVGQETDEYVAEMARIAQDNGATVHTLGLGESHDGYRLATIADEADDQSVCLSSIDHPDCNFETVTDAAGLDQALLEQIFDETTQSYTVDRSHTTLAVDVHGGETETLDLGNVNDPNEYVIEPDDIDPLKTTFENLTFRDDVNFELTVDTDCANPNDAADDTFTDFPGNFEVEYNHRECEAGGNPVTVDENFVFTDGAELEQLQYTQVAEWTKNPAEVIENQYPDLVDNGKLDLKDDDAGTNGAIVMLPVDVNPKGYVLLHVGYDQLPDATHFDVEDVSVENANLAAYENETGVETVVHATGEELTVDFDLTNVARTGTEVVTLETEDGRVLDHKSRKLGTGQSWPDATSEFTWTPAEADIGYEGKLIVSSQNDQMASTVNVRIKEPGADLRIGSFEPNGKVYLDLTGDDHAATEIPGEDRPIEFNVTILNKGPDKGEDELVSLELAEGASMFTTLTVDEIGAWGWNGTVPAGPADNDTFQFQGWNPGFEIVGSWDEDGVGAVRVPYEVKTDDDRLRRDGDQGLLVIYEVDPATAESELEDVDDDDFDPIEVDIDEIELEN